MSSASELLMTSQGEEALTGCPVKVLSQVREQREMYARVAGRWRLLGLLIEFNAVIVTALGCLLMIARLVGQVTTSIDDILLAGASLTGAPLGIQILRRWLGPRDERSCTRRALIC